MDAMAEASTMNVQLYGFWRSVASFRIRVALRLKGIAFDEISVDILFGRALVQAGLRSSECRTCRAYYRARRAFALPVAGDQPTLPLLPADRLERARARMLALVAIADSHPLIVPRIRKHLAVTFGASDDDIRELGAGIGRRRALGEAPPTPFALGPTPGIANICIAGQIVMADAFKVDLTPYPITRELGRRSLALPAFADSRQSAPVAPDPA
jgi:glutathione S-transferase